MKGGLGRGELVRPRGPNKEDGGGAADAPPKVQEAFHRVKLPRNRDLVRGRAAEWRGFCTSSQGLSEKVA